MLTITGYNGNCIQYVVNKKGLSGFRDKVDFVFSRAVLEHVNDISSTIDDMGNALKKGGVSVNKVDFKKSWFTSGKYSRVFDMATFFMEFDVQ